MDELSLRELQQRMASGTLTARALTAAYLERIAALDKRGPLLNAVIELNPAALDIAAALDAERATRGARGPLHGIPIMIKDNIDTADGMTTTAGSLALRGSIAARDAGLVERLRAAGALILGKTNLSEWANFRGERSSSGWSSRGGQTRNPYALDRNPSGSSSGSAVAVAANLCAAAVGTETDGSIVSPASYAGIAGLKPTLGLISRSGIIPIGHSQDTAGPMARTVTDVAILLGALTGVDARDPVTQESQGRASADYTAYLDAEGLRGARLGVARGLVKDNSRLQAFLDGVVATLCRLGAEVVESVELVTLSQLGVNVREVLRYEFKADLNAYLARLRPEVAVHSLAEVIAFNEAHRQVVMPYFGQEHMLEAQKKGDLTTPAYLEALQTSHRLTREEGIDAVLREHRLDAIVALTGGPAGLTDWVNGNHYTGGGCSSMAAAAGYPHLTVPAGAIWGLPIGLSFFAGAYQEGPLLRLAYAFEQGTQARRAPRFLPSVDWRAGE